MDEDTGGFCGRWGAGVIARISRQRSWNQQSWRPRLFFCNYVYSSSLAIVYHVLASVPVKLKQKKNTISQKLLHRSSCEVLAKKKMKKQLSHDDSKIASMKINSQGNEVWIKNLPIDEGWRFGSLKYDTRQVYVTATFDVKLSVTNYLGFRNWVKKRFHYWRYSFHFRWMQRSTWIEWHLILFLLPLKFMHIFVKSIIKSWSLEIEYVGSDGQVIFSQRTNSRK